jgi:hypothetical protein
MVTGRAFYNFGATDEKLRSPYLTVLLLGPTSCFEFWDLKFLAG